MIITLDVETEGLNTQKFILATIRQETGKKKTFYNKQELWEYLLKKGESEQKRKKNLTIYSHNAQYDFYAYAPITDTNMTYYSHRPFIATYKINNKEAIIFLDTLSIYKMSLKKAAELIGETKGEWEKQETTEELEIYCQQDTDITMKLIKKLKEELKKEKILTKRIYTIHQLAARYLIGKLKETTEPEKYFYNTKAGIIHYTKNKEKIHEAYRGGRVTPFKLGTINNVTGIDCNSLYPYSAMQIDFPKLQTERLINEPLEIYRKKTLLNKIGISNCIVQNKNNKIGLLPTRTTTGNYYGKTGDHLIGTWTHIELQEAEKEGYKIKHITWSIIWEKEETNPLKPIFEHMFQKRLESNWHNYIYKALMNGSIGKLAQIRRRQKLIIDTVEKAEEYQKEGYEIANAYELEYLYRKTLPSKPKNYYCPIIPTLINAYARIHMYKIYKEIGEQNLLYTDTDSVYFTGKIPPTIQISNKIGEFKIEHQNETIHIYGKKTYSIGETLHTGGFKGNKINENEIQYTQQITILTTKKKEQLGLIDTKTRNLTETTNKTKENTEKLQENYICIDENIKDIQPYWTFLKQNVFKQKTPIKTNERSSRTILRSRKKHNIPNSRNNI